MRHRSTFIWFVSGASLLMLALSACVIQSHPEADSSYTSRKLENLERKSGPRKVVTIYQFRSSVPEVNGQGATDMFTTALIKSGAFAVAERQRLQEGVVREKQLSAQGLTSSDTGEQRLVGADFIFEGTVSEANPGKGKSGIAGTVRGLGVETSGARAAIGLDIRVIDARTGLVLDAINVRKDVKQRGGTVSGIGAFVQGLTKKDLMGADVNVARDEKEGVDEALRQCIEEAIYQLAKRFGQ